MGDLWELQGDSCDNRECNDIINREAFVHRKINFSRTIEDIRVYCSLICINKYKGDINEN